MRIYKFIRIRGLLPLLLVGVVVYAAWPLFGTRFIPTHDGEYHIIRFFEFYKELAAGHWFPRWASGLNSGYGLPLFIFHYPFPNYLGAFFHNLGASFVDSFKLTLAAGYISAVFFCFLWLKKYFLPLAAATGAIVFATIPYWFVDLYVRGSVGEVLAISFLMLAFASAAYGHRILFAVALAGIVVSHNISAMMFFPLLFAYMAIRKQLWVTSWILGFSIPAYFWLPALMESKYMVGLNTVNFREHFPDFLQLILPSWGTGFSEAGVPNGEMSQQIGLVSIFMCIGALRLMKKQKANTAMKFFLVFGTAIVFLITPMSRVAWETIGPLQLIQFPWRLLAVLMPISAFATAYCVSRSKRWLGWAVAGFSIVLSLGYMRPVTYEPRNDAHYLTRPEFTEGTSSLGNSFSTIWTGWRKERPLVHEEQRGDVRIIHTQYYPGWEAWVDGKKAAVGQSGGLIQVTAASNTQVSVHFNETLGRAIANTISLTGLFWLFGSSILKIYAYRNRRAAS